MAYLLQHLLTEAAARRPQRPAVASGGSELSYSELDRQSTKVARALLNRGVAPGDRVAILVSKSATAVIGLYGALKAGACYVPLDTKAPAERLGYVVRDCAAAVIIADDSTAAQAAVLADGVPGSRGVLLPSDPEVAAQSGEPLEYHRAIETDLAYILYTSGSTGTPKGVMISHRNSLTFVEWAAAAARLTEQDRVCSPAPLHFDLSVFDRSEEHTSELQSP